MTISQWLHSVWFIAPLIIICIFLTVDKFFIVKVSIRRRKSSKPKPVDNSPSLVDNPELDKFLGWKPGPVPADCDPQEWHDFFTRWED